MCHIIIIYHVMSYFNITEIHGSIFSGVLLTITGSSINANIYSVITV